ncbi:MAG: uridine phosphorylase, partial [Cyanobacteria bacterium J06553_1]
QPSVNVGDIVISQASLCRQGTALDIAPPEYPAVADPFLTVALVETARQLDIPYHLGLTASVDSFYEGQERVDSANPRLQPWLQGITESYRQLNILNYEMEVGTLFKMAGVYGFQAACVCAVVAQRTTAESIMLADKEATVQKAISVAMETVAQN